MSDPRHPADDTVPPEAAAADLDTQAEMAAAPATVDPIAAGVDADALLDAAAGDDSPAPGGLDEATLRLAEAIVFSATVPLSPLSLVKLIGGDHDPDAVVAALKDRHAGRGFELVEAAGGVQFRTAPDLGPALRKVIEVPRRLTRVAMETLAIVAYHQPVTRAEIEHLRGASLAQSTLDALLEGKFVYPVGRKEAPGRPTLWGTTPEFLAAFGLADLASLPRREDLFVEPPRAAPPAPEPANDAPEAEKAEE